MLTNFFKNGESPIAQNPIFIVGFPRSGTTLLQALLVTQDNIVSFPETHFFDQFSLNLKTQNGYIISIEKEKFIYEVLQKYSLGQPALDKLIQAMQNGELTKKYLFELIIVDRLLDSTNIDELRSVRWLEKTPMHALHIEEISNYYPLAKLIYIIRNPLNCFASFKDVYKKWGEEFKPVEINVNIFSSAIKTFEIFKKKNPEKIMLVKFEDLVKDYQLEISKICAFLDVKFDSVSLADYRQKTKTIVISSETWKKDVVGLNISTDIAERKGKDGLTGFERYRAIDELNGIVEKYGYRFEKKSKNSLNESDFDINEVIDAINFFRKNLKFKNELLLNYNNKIIDLEQKINNKNKELAEQKRIVETKNKELAEQKHLVEIKNKELTKQKHIVETKNKELEEQNYALEIKNTKLSDKIKNIQQKNNFLEEKVRELNAIYQSRSWKLLLFARRFFYNPFVNFFK